MEVVGFPFFEITAPAGTIVEMMTQEAHDPEKTAWMDNHFYAWTRFIGRGGWNQFAAFDYDSLRWIQLHIRNASGPVTIRNVGVLRRHNDWPHEPLVRCGDQALQRLFDASINTLQEGWTAQPDSPAQWSHCAVVPLYVLAQDIAGIRPTAPGFARCQIRPQLGDLEQLEVVAYTPHGPIRFVAASVTEGRQLRLTIPEGVEAELLVPVSTISSIQLTALAPDTSQGLKRFGLKSGVVNEVLLKSD